MDQSISLSELNTLVKDTVQAGFPGKYNIVAEISEFNESRGHVYLELIEKDKDDQLKAKARATIWANTYRMLKPYFESTTGHHLQAGLKILIVITVEFHEIYGLSLNIKDIDPTYTIGDIEQKRLAVIKKLEDEGVLEMNKELTFPAVAQRIAVISSETAAGYGDFSDQLSENTYGFKFEIKLFQSAMQGEETESSIIEALEKIYESIDDFDIVVIIRGGGSKSDLSWFDSYEIAVNIAQFPIPIITGIGHERDESVADMVAYTNLKTPTAAAEFIINEVLAFYTYLNELGNNFFELVKTKLLKEKNQLEHIRNSIHPLFLKIISAEESELKLIKERVRNSIKENISDHMYKLDLYPSATKNILISIINNKAGSLDVIEMNLKNKVSGYFSKQKHELEVFEQKNNFLNPDNVLKRGYSLTTYKGKTIKSIKDISNNDIVETKLIDGSFKSKVEK